MGRKEIAPIDRQSWVVWDSKHGIVADVTRLAKNRWRVEDYYSGACSTFRTQGQAMHYASQLPDPADLTFASQ